MTNLSSRSSQRTFQGRSSETGYSLRRSLEDQGVTSEKATKEHLSLVYHSLRSGGDLDITRYRVNVNYPNAVSSNMG